MADVENIWDRPFKTETEMVSIKTKPHKIGLELRD